MKGGETNSNHADEVKSTTRSRAQTPGGRRAQSEAHSPVSTTKRWFSSIFGKGGKKEEAVIPSSIPEASLKKNNSGVMYTQEDENGNNRNKPRKSKDKSEMGVNQSIFVPAGGMGIPFNTGFLSVGQGQGQGQKQEPLSSSSRGDRSKNSRRDESSMQQGSVSGKSEYTESNQSEQGGSRNDLPVESNRPALVMKETVGNQNNQGRATSAPPVRSAWSNEPEVQSIQLDEAEVNNKNGSRPPKRPGNVETSQAETGGYYLKGGFGNNSSGFSGDKKMPKKSNSPVIFMQPGAVSRNRSVMGDTMNETNNSMIGKSSIRYCVRVYFPARYTHNIVQM